MAKMGTFLADLITTTTESDPLDSEGIVALSPGSFCVPGVLDNCQNGRCEQYLINQCFPVAGCFDIPVPGVSFCEEVPGLTTPKPSGLPPGMIDNAIKKG